MNSTGQNSWKRTLLQHTALLRTIAKARYLLLRVNNEVRSLLIFHKCAHSPTHTSIKNDIASSGRQRLDPDDRAT